jgi:hypothetical protein
MRYLQNRNENAGSGKRSTVPVPAGISGGATHDSEALIAGEVRVVRLFTDYANAKGIAFGEKCTKIAALLDQM